MTTLRTGTKPHNLLKRGFTLLELILVILLVSILVALSTPQFRKTFSGLELKNTCFNISKMASFAQDMSIIEKTNYRFNIDFESNRYYLTKVIVLEGETKYTKIDGRFGKSFSISPDIRITGDFGSVTFFPDGKITPAHFELYNKYNEGYIITLSDFGKKISIESKSCE